MVSVLGQLVTVLVVTASVRAPCPGSPWQEWRGHCYRLTYQSTPWHGVRGDCRAFFRSADAASIANPQENNFVKTLAGGKTVWLGMRSVNQRIAWLDGQTTNYQNFARSARGAEDVVQMEPSGRWSYAFSHTAPAQHGVCKMPSCRCPAGWTAWDRRCYLAMNLKLSWLEARERCRRMAPTADLVSIINDRENNFVFNLMKGKYPFWIGLNDREEEGSFIWSSGEPYPFRKWHAPSEPNGANHSQDCAEMLPDKTWSDGGCHVPTGRLNPFVCEQILCGRDKQILPDQYRGREMRLWKPDDGSRCPAGWTRSGDRCLSQPTESGSFARVQQECTSLHPSANIALMTSIEDNDAAYFLAGSFPIWVDYGSRSGRALSSADSQRLRQSTFTNWEEDVRLARNVENDCAAMQELSKWRPKRCNRDEFPAMCEIPVCEPKCAPGWIPFEGHCYRVVAPRNTRAQSALICQKDGGELASIQSQQENDFLLRLAFRSGRDYSDPLSRLAWIGARRRDVSSPWSWSDCSDWTLSRWQRGDGDAASLTVNTCAALFSTSGRWSDNVDCLETKLSAICEVDPCRDHFGPAASPSCRDGKVIDPSAPGNTPQTTAKPRPEPTPATTASPGPEFPLPQERLVCPATWTLLGDYCYGGVEPKNTFIGALQKCTTTYSPAHVASAHNQQENQLLLSLSGGGPVWLGLTAAYDFPEWTWMDGSERGAFSPWARGQPDATSENMKLCAVVNKRGRWAARSCTTGRHHFVCRLPAVRLVANPSCPDPTTWREEAGSCYAFNREGMPFPRARASCASMGNSTVRVRLPIISDAQEDATLQRLANGHVIRLGLSRSGDGRWLWEDGTEPGYTNWLETPPAGQGPLCAVLDSRRGGWLAQDCNNNVAFYCEVAASGEALPGTQPDDYDDYYDDDCDY